MPNISFERPVRTAATPMATLVALLESMRPYQWVKNALVLVPLAAAHRLNDLALLSHAVRAFIAFSLCASSVYLLNDLWDAPADRLHPHKRERPIASGRLLVGYAMVLAVLLLAAGIATALPLGLRTTAALLVYFALMTGYSRRLKSIVLLDALVLGCGYALRVVAGAFAVGILPSARLVGFCIFLFFSLALLKRYAELALLRLRDGADAHTRAYLLEDQEFILVLGVSCGALSALVLDLYLSSEAAAQLYSHSGFILIDCVLLLYWVSHMWLTAHRGRMTDDPLVFALKDRVSLLLIILMGLTAWLAV